jgi:hypothetical protein
MSTFAARRIHRHPASIAAVLCAGFIAAGLRPLHAALETPTVSWRTDSLRPGDIWNTLTLDMSVARRHVTKSGAATGVPSPSATYRIERSSRTGSWKTVVTVLGVQLPPRYSLNGALIQPAPVPVGRIEDDEDGTPLRVYDRSGRLMKTPLVKSSTDPSAAFAPPRSNGREWIETFVATSAKKTTRQQDFERQFGRAQRVGTLYRFLHRDSDQTQEVLVDQKNVVAVENNSSRSGRLLGHRTFTYASAPDGAVVRTSVHAETLVTPETGERAIVDTTFSNIRLWQRR